MSDQDEFDEHLTDGVVALLDGLLLNVPVVGVAVSIARAAEKRSEALYKRKVARILSETASVTERDKAMFLLALDRDGEKERFGEAIALAIDRIDEMQKASLIGRIIAGLMRGEASRKEALRLCAAVNKTYYDDLLTLKDFVGGVQGENEASADALFSSGLLYNRGIDGGTLDGKNHGGTIYELNEHGRLLAKLIY